MASSSSWAPRTGSASIRLPTTIASFSALAGRARTIAAWGEKLPLEDASFDLVLCDNVVDHAENPRRIVEEIARVLAPRRDPLFRGEHPSPAVSRHRDRACRVESARHPVEITPFADHTVHLTLDAARALFEGLPFRILAETNNIDEVKRQYPQIRHPGDRLKRLFFKNAQYEVIASASKSAAA